MIELENQDNDIFMFMLPIVIFSTFGRKEASSNEKMVSEQQLYFSQLLEKNILFQGKGDERAGAIRFGMANDLMRKFQEL